jgi:hypothetical protein
VDINNYRPLQPEVTEDFPTMHTTSPRIPHIIHQTYRSRLIPSKFKHFVISFITNNPSWTYYFWTDESARKLIAERHPSFLSTWDNYRSGVNRADALRYFVLYHFGGIYADLDVENFRPLDRATMMYACIFPPEPLEQGILRLNLPLLINNAIMMCRPKHPFLKQMIDNLPYFRPMADQIDLAGPTFVTSQFLVYNNISGDQYISERTLTESNSPYVYKGLLPEYSQNAVYIPNTRYFLDTFDNHEPFNSAAYHKMCTQNFDNLNHLQQRACAELHRRGFYRQPSEYVFTKHHWSQTYAKLDLIPKLTEYFTSFFQPWNVDIQTVLPHFCEFGREQTRACFI